MEKIMDMKLKRILIHGLAAAVLFAAAICFAQTYTYAVTYDVEFGTYNGSSPVDGVRKKANLVDLGTIDLSKINQNDESTYLVEKKVYLKGGQNSGLTIKESDVDVEGNADLYFCFDSGTNQTYIDNKVPYMVTSVSFDARRLVAGSYTAKLKVKAWVDAGGSYQDVDLSANNGALKSKDGYLVVPVTVKLTGVNSDLASAVTGLTSKAGNGQVKLSWNASECGLNEGFSIYRRDGKETAAQGQYDLSKYTLVNKDSDGDSTRILQTSYTDKSVQNGKTYSYFVIAGSSFLTAYPSNAVIATPSSTAVKEPAPPLLTSPDYDIGTVTLEWKLDDDAKDELNMIDHFNVYRSGVIVAQVSKNAFKDDVTQEYDEEQDKTVDVHSYSWKVTLDSDPGVVYKWWVTAVSNAGVEGSPSDKYDEGAQDKTPLISKYNAWYTEDYQEDDDPAYKRAICLKVNDASYYNAEYVHIYRKAGSGSFTDLGKKPYKAVYGDGIYDYADTAITQGTKYTYRISVIDFKKKESEPVEFSISASSGSEALRVDTYYSLDDKNRPTVDFYGYSGSSYKLYRQKGNASATQIKSWSGSNADISYSDSSMDSAADGTYTFYVTRTQGGSTATSSKYKYIKDTSKKTLGQKPGAPSLSARVTGTDNGTIALKWSKSSEGGAPDGYYIYKKRMMPVYDEQTNAIIGYSEGFDTERFSESDGYINEWYYTENPQDRYTRLYADKKSFTDPISWGYEEQFPVKYYVCAYNQYGVSEPSEVITYQYDEGRAPSNPDTAAPGKPVITNTWVEANEYYENRRMCYVTWDAPVSGRVDRYEIVLQKKENNSWTDKDSVTVYLGQERKQYFELDNTRQEDRGTYRFIVRAINGINEAVPLGNDSANYVVSDTFLISSLPKLSLEAKQLSGSRYSVTLNWDDTNYKSTVDKTSYIIYRKDEYGVWTVISEGGTGVSGSNGKFKYTDSSNSLETGSTYIYRLKVTNTQGTVRFSDTRKVTLAATAILPCKPAGVKAIKTDEYDSYLLTWTMPSGGKPLKYNVQYDYGEEGAPDWIDAVDIPGSATSYGGVFRADKIRLVAENDAGRGEPSDTIDLSQLPGRSDEYYPYPIKPTVTTSKTTDSEPWVKLSWTKVNREYWGEALYYSIYRYDGTAYNERLVADIPAVNGKDSYEWVDKDVESGQNYEYWLRPCNGYGYYYDNEGVSAVPESSKETFTQMVVRKVKALINAIITPVDTSSSEQVDRINETNDIYNSMTDDQKEALDDDDATLAEKLRAAVDVVRNAAAQQTYQADDGSGQLTTKPVQDQIDAACNAVIAKYGSVDAIDTTVLSDADLLDQIKAARKAYEDLSENAQRTVNVMIFSQIETRINDLKQYGGDEAAAIAVLNKLNSLPSVADYNVASGDEAKRIENQADEARRSMEALLPDQTAILKQFSGYNAAYSKLTALEEAISSKDTTAVNNVIAKINELPDPDTITQDNVDAVQAQIDSITALILAFTDGQNELYNNSDEGKAAKSRLMSVQTAVENAKGDAHVHTWGDWIITKAPTCTQTGSKKHTCLYCTAEETAEIAATSQHTWGGGTVTTKATCISDGVRTFKCRNCEATKTETIPKADGEHDWNDWVEKTPATCTTAGEKERTCKHSSSHKETEAIPAKGHTWDDGDVVTDATCTNAGTMKYTCTACHAEYTEPIPAKGHNMGAWKTDKAATCTSRGLESRSCRNEGCDYTETRETAALGHGNWSSYVTVNPTEESQGAMAHRCGRCGYTYHTAIAPIALPTDLPYVKVSKPAKGKKAITVKWKKPKKKQLKQIGGIEIQVTGPSGTITTTAGKKKASKKIKGLLPKQTYSCRVRAYNYIGGVKHVSAWSNWKTAKTK